MRRKSITSEMMKSFIAESLLLLLEQQPFDEITVGQIVMRAGVNRSTYYRHFENKEDIILYFLDSISEDILKWDKTQEPEFQDHLISIYRHFYSHKPQLLTIYKNNLFYLFLEILKKYLGPVDPTENSPDIQYNVAFHIGGTFNHFSLWLSRGMADSPEDMVKHTLAVLPKDLIDHVWNAAKQRVV